jgi:NAD-dependent DNA ligase
MSTFEEVFTALNAEHEKFQFALGRMTLRWADLESALYTVLRNYSGVSTEVARALFAGERARSLIDKIKAIAHNTNMEAERLADLEEIFKHINTMNTMRDRLVHHVDGSQVEFDMHDVTTRTLSNERRVTKLGKEFRYKIGAQHVAAMNDDMLECCWRLVNAHTEKANEPFKQGTGPTGKRQEWKYAEPPQV